MTIEEQLSKKTIDLASAITERDEIRVAMENIVAKEQTELKELNEKVGSLGSQVETLLTEKADLLKQIAELQNEKVSASVEAAKIVASVGVSPVEMSPAEQNTKSVSHLETFLAMSPGPDRTSYYAKYKNEIIRGI